MSASIERIRSKPLAERRKASELTPFDRPLAELMPAIEFGAKLRERENQFRTWLIPERCSVGNARAARAQWLPLFGRADAARELLDRELALRVDRQTAAAMVSAMLAGFGSKPDPDVLAATLAMIGADEVARATGLWDPIRATPATLALACMKLIATAPKFAPKAAELRESLNDARNRLRWARDAAEALCCFVQRADAIMLRWADRDEWMRPYRTREYAPLLPRILAMHDAHGDGSPGWDERDPDVPNRFEALVSAEREKLVEALPAAEPQRLAACAVRPAKRTQKPRGKGHA
jgi:hypothetical protein